MKEPTTIPTTLDIFLTNFHYPLGGMGITMLICVILSPALLNRIDILILFVAVVQLSAIGIIMGLFFYDGLKNKNYFLMTLGLFGMILGIGMSFRFPHGLLTALIPTKLMLAGFCLVSWIVTIIWLIIRNRRIKSAKEDEL